MRMYCLLFATALVAMTVGCADSVAVGRASVLSPGRELRLTFREELHEMRTGGALVMEEWDTFVTKDGTVSSTRFTRREGGLPSTSVAWTEMELPLSVVAVPGSDSLRATMKVQRYRSGGSYVEDGQKEHEESVSFEAGEPSQPESDSGEDLRDVEFIAVIDAQGRLVSSDVTGKYLAERKKELAEGVKQGGSQAQADMALRWETPGVFAALEDAMAYSPRGEVKTGQSWTVRRKCVLPYQAYAFYMLTNGCAYSQEKARCTVQSVKARGPHSIATIAIRGRRVPRDPAPSMPRKVKHFELKGELEANLTTGAIERLRLESTPTWVRPKEEAAFNIKFVEVITLKPI